MVTTIIKLGVGVVCLSVSGVVSARENGSEKIPLTREQILTGMPDRILNPGVLNGGWQDNNRLFFHLVSPGKPAEKWVYDIKTGKTAEAGETKTAVEQDSSRVKLMAKLSESIGKDHFAKSKNKHFSPDLSMIAYTRDNNLYLFSFVTEKETPVTQDGSAVIMNGYASWVYYEEILGRPSKYKAYWWSPDSKKIAWYKFDDTQVPMFPIYNSNGKHGSITETRYPQAGDENPKVDILIADVSAVNLGKEEIARVKVDFNREDDQYFGIPFWNADGSRFIVPWMPREQNHLILYTVRPEAGTRDKIYEEHQDTWIDWMDEMHFTEDGFYMIRDFDLWEQIYFQSFDGKKLEKVTSGKNWGIHIVKVDEKEGAIYFTARREVSTRNDFYRVDLKTKTIKRLSEGDYNYASVMLPDNNKYFTALRSNSSTPWQLVLISTGKKPDVKILQDTKGARFDEYHLAIPQMMYMTVDGYTLPAQVIWPVNLDSTRKYPVLVSIYGGPNAGTVMDTWKGLGENTQWWANEGVIQVSIDHRASGHCGKEGLNFLHRHLLTVELSDYIAWIKELYKYPFVDREKVGITGFSYGGSMTMLAITEGSDYFKYGIAGGGVYDYELYDSHYTERYMDRPQDNPEGYKNTRIMDKVFKYKGDKSNYVKITHGTSDDNVHMQNTMQLAEALQGAGKQFDLMLYPGGFHGYRGAQSLHSNTGDYIFWYRYLLDKEAPEILFQEKIAHR